MRSSRRIVGAIDPGAIWLFGSRARGDARPDSDFDLLVVGKPGADLGSDDYERVDRPLHGLGIGCDVVPCAAEDFEEALSNTFRHADRRESEVDAAGRSRPLTDF